MHAIDIMTTVSAGHPGIAEKFEHTLRAWHIARHLLPLDSGVVLKDKEEKE